MGIAGSVRGLGRDTRGAEIAEAAAVLPLMFMMLLGIFWFGQAFSMYGAITRAAQDGARAGAMSYCATCTGTNTLTQYVTNATTAVQNSLIASHLDPTKIQNSGPPSFSYCSTPQIQCPSTGQPCVEIPVQLLTGAQGGGDCGISVSFSYPFKFWLPFTSINKQQILLTAAARVRLETR